MPDEIDTKGLSKAFVLKVMVAAIEDHKRQHVAPTYPGAIECTLETCPPRWFDEESGETPQEAFEWDHEYGGRHHIDLGPENAVLIEVKGPMDPNDPNNYGCSHYVEVWYTHGTQLREWHAGYGVNEETDKINVWCD